MTTEHDIDSLIHRASAGEELTEDERTALAAHFSRKGPQGWARVYKKGQEVEIGGIVGSVVHAGRKNLTVRIK